MLLMRLDSVPPGRGPAGNCLEPTLIDWAVYGFTNRKMYCDASSVISLLCMTVNCFGNTTASAWEVRTNQGGQNSGFKTAKPITIVAAVLCVVRPPFHSPVVLLSQ